jgi:two-component system chemotaxis response regulator CheB
MTIDAGSRHTVLVVDDSAFMRKLIAEMLSSEPGFSVVGFARNGVEALQQVERLDPDLVTLDLEMPQLNGLQVLAQIMAKSPRPIVVLSAGDPQFGDATMRALELGAVDFVKKPSGPISLDLPEIRVQLMESLYAALAVDMRTMGRIGPVPRGGVDKPRTSVTGTAAGVNLKRPLVPARHIVVIAASTGGPRALAEIIPMLPDNLDAAVLIAQHMPKEFTRSLAHRLDQTSQLHVGQAVDGELILAGRVYVAPGKMHMRVAGVPGTATIVLDAHAVGVSPSADQLFISAADAFGKDVLGVVLTGMGRDGAEGARVVSGAGGAVLVQDRATSVIYGMPGATLTIAMASRVVALHDIAAAIVQAIASLVKTAELGVGLRV